MGCLAKTFYHTGKWTASRPFTAIFIGIISVMIGAFGFVNFSATVSNTIDFKNIAQQKHLYFCGLDWRVSNEVIYIGQSLSTLGATSIESCNWAGLLCERIWILLQNQHGVDHPTQRGRRTCGHIPETISQSIVLLAIPYWKWCSWSKWLEIYAQRLLL